LVADPKNKKLRETLAAYLPKNPAKPVREAVPV
jgi:hypothetical protein